MKYDLIIVGGGFVGSALALTLQNTALSIALIDAKPFANLDPRLFALNVSSCELLKHLQVWPEISASASAIHKVHVSRQHQFGVVHLDHNDLNLSELGHVVPAQNLEQVLYEKLSQINNISLFRPAVLTEINMQDDAALKIKLNQHEEKILRATIVIAADGTNSSVRQLLNIKTDAHDYAQSAIVTRVQLKRAHENIAYERLLTDGAIAMLPLKNNQCAMIWSAAKEKIAVLKNLSDVEFIAALQQEFGFRLGKLQHIETRYEFPLQQICVKENPYQNLILMGNALHTLHPIAAQGLNLAIYEAACLVEIILKNLKNNMLFHHSLQQSLQTMTQQQQANSIGISHKLAHMFQDNKFSSNAALQIGMLGLQFIKPFKKMFIARMINRSGQVPSLLLPSDAL